MPELEKGLGEGLKRLATTTASPTTAPQVPPKVETSQPTVRRLGSSRMARGSGQVPHSQGGEMVAHPIGGEVHDEKYGPGKIVGHRTEQVGGHAQMRYHVKFDSGKEFHAHHEQIARADAPTQASGHARMVLKSRGGVMAENRDEEEVQEPKGGLAKAMDSMKALLKGKKPMVPPPDPDEEDDGPPAPSTDDQVDSAAPKKGVPPGGPAAPDDKDGDGDPDEQDDDDGKDDDGDGSDQDGDDGKDDEDDDQQDDGKGDDQQGNDPDDGKDDEEDDEPDDDEALKKKVLRRSKENPDLFKALYQSEMGQQVADMVDGTQVLAFVVQTFDEMLGAERAHSDAIVKGLVARLERQEEATGVVLDALAKSLEYQEALLKSSRSQATLLKSIEATPSGTVATGLGMIRPAAHRDPTDDAPVDPNLPASGKVRDALFKSGGAGILGRERAGELMAMLDSQGVGVVMKAIGDNPRFTALLK